MAKTFYDEWLTTPSRIQDELENSRLVARDKDIPWVSTPQDASEDHLGEHLPILKKLRWILYLHVDPPDFIAHESLIRALPTVTIIDHMARVREKMVSTSRHSCFFSTC